MADVPTDDLERAKNLLREVDENKIFQRMLVNDKIQNKSISERLTKSNGYKLSKGPENVQKDGQTRMRFLVCTLGVLSLAMGQMCRGTVNLCITSMVHPSMLHKPGGQEDTTSPRSDLPSNLNDEILETTTMFIEQLSGGEQTQEANFSDPILYYITESPQLESTSSPDSNRDFGQENDGSSDTDSVSDPILYMLTEDSNQESNEVTESNHVEITTIMENDEIDEQPDDQADQADRFMWTVKQQSLVKGGFFYSYFFFMILGGRISEIYGAKYVILIGVLGSSLINLATPWMARNSFALLVSSRILMGVLQSGILPAMYALVARWLTMSEASIYAPMMKMSLRIGQLLASMVPGLVPEWPYAFYVVGLTGVVWSALFMILATSDPSTNRWVNELELRHINRKKRIFKTDKPEAIMMVDCKINGNSKANGAQNGHETTKKVESNSAPWIKILTSPSVIALIIVKFSYNLCPDFISIELPSYLNYARQLSRQKISVLMTAIFSIQVTLIVPAGWMAKEMIKRKPLGMTKTTVRKCMQGICSIGGGLILLLIAIGSMDLSLTAIAFQMVGFVCIFAAGGETMVPYDLSEQYPATIMGIANSVANLSGIAITALTGLMLDNQANNLERWHQVIALVGAGELIGGLIFVSIYKAEILKFERQKTTGDLELAIPDIKAIAKLPPKSTKSEEDAQAEKPDKEAQAPSDDLEKEMDHVEK